MEQVFIKLLNLSISASWLILVILLLRPLLRKAPKRLSCIPWGLVDLRLILPFSIKSILSLIPSAETIPANIIYSRSPAIRSGFPALNTAINPVISESFSPNPAASTNPLQIISFIASVIWLIGVISMASGLGGSLMATVFSRIIVVYGWRTAFLVEGASNLGGVRRRKALQTQRMPLANREALYAVRTISRPQTIV